MKTNVIPSQITTIEDRVLGSLTVSQALILGADALVVLILYPVLSLFLASLVYKLLILIPIASMGLSLSVRLRGMLLYSWLLLIAHYGMRPRYYAFQKQASRLENIPPQSSMSTTSMATPDDSTKTTRPTLCMPLGIDELIRLEHYLGLAGSREIYKFTKKGRPYVTTSEEY